MELKNLSSNWKKLQEQLKISSSTGPKQSSLPNGQHGLKRKRIEPTSSLLGKKPTQTHKKPKMLRASRSTTSLKPDPEPQDVTLDEGPDSKPSVKSSSAPPRVNEGLSSTAEVRKYVAIDCEMVGVGPDPDRESALARVSVVNYDGDQIYDSFVRPKEAVTDWRTHVSGVTAKHMIGARSLEEVQVDISRLLDGKILVGHAVRNDLEALLLGHPKRDIRDTSRHPPFRKFAGGGSPRLKVLAAELLGMEIQEGSHSSVEDARACMLLFRREKDAFEKEHARRWPAHHTNDGRKEGDSQNGKKKKKSKKKKKK